MLNMQFIRMNGITTTTKPVLTALNSRLFEAIKPIAPEGTTMFGEVIKHPTLNKWVLVIKTNGYYWETVQATLTIEEKESITELTSDWFG
jgi:hypothetical protein